MDNYQSIEPDINNVNLKFKVTLEQKQELEATGFKPGCEITVQFIMNEKINKEEFINGKSLFCQKLIHPITCKQCNKDNKYNK